MKSLAGVFQTPLPKGYLSHGVNCGVRRYRPDLGVIVSEQPAVAAAVYTQSTLKAATIVHCQSILPGNNIKAIVTNSGQANAATGEQGVKDNDAMAAAVAKQLGCEPSQVLTASTGVIGEPMEIDKITAGCPELIKNLSHSADKFALAILTTDLVPKVIHQTVQLSQGEITLTGIAKGSGMIHPNMATMLGYLLSDVALTVEQAQSLVKSVCDESFNMISVDGETSTNDCVFLMANGAAKVALVTEDDEQAFKSALQHVAIQLAKSIASDGEGATKLIEVNIKNASDLAKAKQIARSLTVSPLLKSAVYGDSPNWGRIIARLGHEQTPPAWLAQCAIQFQEINVFQSGQPLAYDQEKLKSLMKSNHMYITIDFKAGESSATAWGCDLSERYVKINAEYVS